MSDGMIEFEFSLMAVNTNFKESNIAYTLSKPYLDLFSDITRLLAAKNYAGAKEKLEEAVQNLEQLAKDRDFLKEYTFEHMYEIPYDFRDAFLWMNRMYLWFIPEQQSFIAESLDKINGEV